MTVLEHVGFDREVIADYPLHHVAAAIDERLEILNNRGWKSPKHGAINQLRFARGERGNYAGGRSSRVKDSTASSDHGHNLAGGFETWHALRHPGPVPTDWGLLALGTIVSAITAFLVVRWLIRWVQTHSFTPFGWYRIALGLAMLMRFV